MESGDSDWHTVVDQAATATLRWGRFLRRYLGIRKLQLDSATIGQFLQDRTGAITEEARKRAAKVYPIQR